MRRAVLAERQPGDRQNPLQPRVAGARRGVRYAARRAPLRGGATADAAGLRSGAPRRGVRDRVVGRNQFYLGGAPRRSGTSGGHCRGPTRMPVLGRSITVRFGGSGDDAGGPAAVGGGGAARAPGAARSRTACRTRWPG